MLYDELRGFYMLVKKQGVQDRVLFELQENEFENQAARLHGILCLA